MNQPVYEVIALEGPFDSPVIGYINGLQAAYVDYRFPSSIPLNRDRGLGISGLDISSPPYLPRPAVKGYRADGLFVAVQWTNAPSVYEALLTAQAE